MILELITVVTICDHEHVSDSSTNDDNDGDNRPELSPEVGIFILMIHISMIQGFTRSRQIIIIITIQE